MALSVVIVRLVVLPLAAVTGVFLCSLAASRSGAAPGVWCAWGGAPPVLLTFCSDDWRATLVSGLIAYFSARAFSGLLPPVSRPAPPPGGNVTIGT